MKITTVHPDNLLVETAVTDRRLLAESLLDHYFAVIHRLALSILRDDDEADDVAQDTFITALRRIDRYDPGTNMRAWLSTIAINLCRDRLRRQKARLKWRDLWSKTQSGGAARSRDPESRHIRFEANATLWRSVYTLDEKHRLPIILRYVNGLSVGEVAEILQVPEGTIHSRLHYASKKLAAALVGADVESLVMELFNE
jgi:RNA polymerase sigma-70 factor (ECF subfamily)